MCRVLSVSQSAFYAWRSRPSCAHQRRDEQLSHKIEQVFHESRGRYGSPRVHQELQARGEVCSEKRVARLMRERKLAVKTRRGFVSTTDCKHTYPVAPNVLNRRFDVEQVEDLNRAWAGDITFIPTAKGWLYLAVVLDLKSRKVIGWSMSDTLEQTLVHHALALAVGQRLTGPAGQGLLFHSDRGSQYAAHQYQEKLAQWE